MQRTHKPALGIDDDELRDLRRSLHQLHAVDRETVRTDHTRVSRHELGHSRGARVADAAETAPQIAVGEDARDPSLGVDDDRHAHAFSAHLDHGCSERCVEGYRGNGVAGAHHVLDSRKQPSPERAARMRAGEILDREAARVKQSQRQRVA